MDNTTGPQQNANDRRRVSPAEAEQVEEYYRGMHNGTALNGIDQIIEEKALREQAKFYKPGSGVPQPLPLETSGAGQGVSNDEPAPAYSTVYDRFAVGPDGGVNAGPVDGETTMVINNRLQQVVSDPGFVDPSDPVSPQYTTDSAGAVDANPEDLTSPGLSTHGDPSPASFVGAEFDRTKIPDSGHSPTVKDKQSKEK